MLARYSGLVSNIREFGSVSELPAAVIGQYVADGATISTAPEPTVWILFLIGFGIVGIDKRSRAKGLTLRTQA